MCYQIFLSGSHKKKKNRFDQWNWLQIKGKGAKVEKAAAVNLWNGN